VKGRRLRCDYSLLKSEKMLTYGRLEKLLGFQYPTALYNLALESATAKEVICRHPFIDSKIILAKQFAR